MQVMKNLAREPEKWKEAENGLAVLAAWQGRRGITEEKEKARSLLGGGVMSCEG